MVELFCNPWWDGVGTYQSKRGENIEEGDEFFGMVLWYVLKKRDLIIYKSNLNL